VAVCVHNTTEVPEGLDRAGALRRSLLSTHLVAVFFALLKGVFAYFINDHRELQLSF